MNHFADLEHADLTELAEALGVWADNYLHNDGCFGHRSVQAYVRAPLEVWRNRCRKGKPMLDDQTREKFHLTAPEQPAPTAPVIAQNLPRAALEKIVREIQGILFIDLDDKGREIWNPDKPMWGAAEFIQDVTKLLHEYKMVPLETAEVKS